MNKYRAILTEAGLNKLAAATLTGEPAGFSSMGVGDGGGTLYQPH
ncbi:phage tail protein, partial [Klebsiella pneumoniae]